jgi:simple sugar transport system permease protein
MRELVLLAALALLAQMGLFSINQPSTLATLFAITRHRGSLPPVIHVAFIMTVAIVVGAAYAGIAGVLKVKRGVNEVIATIMLNYIAIGTISYLLTNQFKEETVGVGVTKTPNIDRSGWMPDLNAAIEKLGFHFPANTRLYGYIVLAAILGIAFYFVVWRTRFGFELRSSGINPAAARASGVNPGRMIIATMLISGGLAGLVGMGPLLSDTRYFEASGGRFPLSLGFTGIGVALLGRNHPVRIALGAIVYAGIRRRRRCCRHSASPPRSAASSRARSSSRR